MTKSFRPRTKGMDSIRYDSYGSVMDMISTADSYVFNIVTKKDKIRNEAIRLIKEWNGINMNNIDDYLKQINTLHIVTTKILDNIKYVEEQNSMLSYMSGKFSNINGVIDTYNDFIDKNPLLRLGTKNGKSGYGKLHHLDLSGVMRV